MAATHARRPRRRTHRHQQLNPRARRGNNRAPRASVRGLVVDELRAPHVWVRRPGSDRGRGDIAAPGTAGTLWAWASFVVLDWLMPSSMWFWILAVGLVVGIWACEKTGRALGQSDHGAMVWDEVMAFWLVLVCLPHPADPDYFGTSQGLSVWLLQAVAFGLFRFFDIMKPPPIKWVDQHCKGGWGVMADDLVAAALTLLAVALLLRLWPWLA